MFFDKIIGLLDIASREEHQAPDFEYRLSPGRAHFVGNLKTCTKILQDKRFVQDQSLMELAIQTESRWLKYFIAESPEFRDAAAHQQARRTLQPHLEKLVQISKSRPQQLLKLCRPTPALEIAKVLSRNLITDLLGEWVGKPISLGIQLFELDIFTPTIRLTRDFQDLEVELGKVVNQLPPVGEGQLLMVLTMLLMAIRPLVANTTAFLNAIAEKKRIDLDYYTTYSIAPVNYTIRRATEDFSIDQVKLQKGDVVYVRLFSGCPFKKGLNLMFGSGQHACQGKALAKELAHQSLKSIIELEKKEYIVASKVRPNGPHPFLSYS